MSARVTRLQLKNELHQLGVTAGDCILVRASLGAVGRTEGRETALDALLDAVGVGGTVVSLAFTDSAFIRKPRKEDAFHPLKPSYAGALPNMMIAREEAKRSRHPTCSYVAIGRHADYITEDHTEHSGAYEPIRKIVELSGKCILIGCVGSSPGFTTTHLAEADLGLLRRAAFPGLRSTYFIAEDGQVKLYRRSDPGMCSASFYKFYAHYVREGILSVGHVGAAYSILAPAAATYSIERAVLKEDPKFNICGSPICVTCNAGRWDQIHKAPGLFVRLLAKRLSRR
jgi:aminoglycoside N3'-acetyltransferase